MAARQLVVILIAMLCILFASNLQVTIAQQIIYPGQAESERDLSTCKPYEICSIVHKRYWLPIQVDRLCRCDSNSSQQECSTSWSDRGDNDHNYTMSLNNRAQMKFCDAVTALPDCLAGGNDTRTKFLHINNETKIEYFNNVTVKSYALTSKAECFCGAHNTWIAHEYHKNEMSVTSLSYRCSQLARCKADEFCGFERTDLYSIYYKCSCPLSHLCVRHNSSIIRQVNEILYEGSAYTTNCLKITSQ